MARKKKQTENSITEPVITEKSFEKKIEEIIEKIESMEDDSLYMIEIDGQNIGGIVSPVYGRIWKSLLPEIRLLKEE